MAVTRLVKKLGVDHVAFAYAMTTLGSCMINNIFSFYYVKLFLNKYKINERAFHQSQVVYMIWNAVNDPLFGYIQDNSSVPCCSKRRLSILYGAPLYSLAFLLAWFPWRSYNPGDWMSGVHLMVALCAFDALLTFVLLAQCALFAEISNHHQSRLRLVKYSQVASLIGSSSILLSGVVSRNMEDFASFQTFTVVIAVLSCGCMLYTGFYCDSCFDNKVTEPKDQVSHNISNSISLMQSQIWQILTNRDFQLFVLMNFCQVFILAFFNNFTLIFTEHLIPPDVLPTLAKSVMYGAGFICPQLLVLSCQSLLHSIGYYKIILITFYVEAGMGIAMLVLGPQHYYILALFLTINMIIIQAAFSLFGLPLADIIDSDLHKHKRNCPLSSMVFGTNALFTKPAQSLAPMIVLAILNQFGYEQLKEAVKESNQSDLESLHKIMFYLVCLVPLTVAVLQILFFKPFSIRDSHTVQSKYIDS
ncbi:transmembrane protein 180-like isoform X1 [Boleophthalmus pectinirostris]|uniref:transmembrane protein 180-like isoform X1 n=1 Tax=Boleophthalmus pectinirostris TaxID=150288 RepID=UPI000A1C5E67|nr:transmembrane protein 180-like isoform X1 [Boleophthalmus pectinirostris]